MITYEKTTALPALNVGGDGYHDRFLPEDQKRKRSELANHSFGLIEYT